MPVKFLGSSTIDVGVEYGRRGYNLSERLGLVRQQYFKFSVGFSLFAGAENRGILVPQAEIRLVFGPEKLHVRGISSNLRPRHGGSLTDENNYKYKKYKKLISDR